MGRHKVIGDRELLDVARGVFRRRGHSATTREVAGAAGISQAALYQRFKTKDELFFAAMLPQSRDVSEPLGAPENVSGGVEEHLVAIALRMVDFFTATMPSILHLVTHPRFGPEALSHAHDHLLATGLIARLADRIRLLQGRDLVARIDAVAAAETLVGAIHSLVVFQIFAGRRPARSEQRVRQVVRVLCRGLLPRRRA